MEVYILNVSRKINNKTKTTICGVCTGILQYYQQYISAVDVNPKPSRAMQAFSQYVDVDVVCRRRLKASLTPLKYNNK